MKELLGKTMGNYLLQRILGQGRMGVVFLAHDRALLRPTALKLLAWSISTDTDQDPVRWFLSEARSVARISHPNVIQIYNIAKHAEHKYIAMEYVDGCSVEQELLQKGRFSVHRATDILLQTSAALGAAHKCGVVHRDIKPANLLLRNDGIVKMSDFGMSINNHPDSLLSAGMRVGTPFFNAPETWEGRPASAASDLYSLGVTYFLLLTGKLPFEAKDMKELQMKHLHEAPPDPRKYIRGLPERSVEIIARCLHKNPAKRFESATTLEQATQSLMEEISHRKPSSAGPTTTTSARRSAVRRAHLAPASQLFKRAFGFEYEPFSTVDALQSPYTGGPFDTVYSQLSDALSEKKRLILLTGASGSGKSTLLKRFLLRTRDDKACVYFGKEGSRSNFPIADDLHRTAMTSSGRTVAEERKLGESVIAVWDEYPCSVSAEAELEQCIDRSVVGGNLIWIVALTPSMVSLRQLLLLQSDSVEISLPGMDTEGGIEYMRQWLRHTLPPSAPMLLFSTDASLMIVKYSRGIPSAVNRLARGALISAARRGSKVVSSFDAWLSNETGSEEALENLKQVVRPSKWPTAEVLSLINECRGEVGIAPLSTEDGSLWNRKTTKNEGGMAHE